MRFVSTLFGRLLEPVSRRDFDRLVARHEADKWSKKVSCWDQFISLLYAQLAGQESLRDLEAGLRAQAGAHYHLGFRPIPRSSLAEANAKRPSALYRDMLGLMLVQADRRTRGEARALVRLIDATPIPVAAPHGAPSRRAQTPDWAQCAGRTRGLKAHLVYDPERKLPLDCTLTPATVNDVVAARDLPIEPGAVYVFDKAYCDFRWWRRLQQAGCRFVTRAKTNLRVEVLETRPCAPPPKGEPGLLKCRRVRLKNKAAGAFNGELMLIDLRREDGRTLQLLSNAADADPADIAALYKRRWAIELLFKWIKQNLNIKRFLGRSENAVRSQVYVAVIAYLLLRLLHAREKPAIPLKRTLVLIAQSLFRRLTLTDLLATPPPKEKPPQQQLGFSL